MKKTTLIAALLLGPVLTGSLAAADEPGNQAAVGVQYYGINGDEGRFREDRFMKDKALGGIENLHFDSEKFDIDLKALGHDHYKIRSRFKKDDLGYVLIKGQWARRYFDGSNEYWDPAAYNLTGGEAIPDNRTTPPGSIDDGFYSTEDFADRADGRLYADRLDVTLELGLTAPDYPETIFGFRRWERRGKELLLRGERVVPPAGSGLPTIRTIGALATIKGQSDLYYADISKVAAEKHTLRLRHEYETYRDQQYIEFPRYKQGGGTGVIDQYRTFDDDPKFKSHVSVATIDSQINEDTLVAGGATVGYLKNESARDVVRPNVANPWNKVGTSVKNIRRNHAATIGFRRAKVAGVDGLDAVGGLRAERVDTNSESFTLNNATTPREARTSFDETRWIEDFELRFRRWKNTTVSFRVRLEQRDLDQTEFGDMGNHETVEANHFNSGVQFLDYRAEIKHRNQEFGLKAVNRSFPVKIEAALKYVEKDRDYLVKRDSMPSFYPGSIGSLEIKRKEASIGLSRLLPKAGYASAKYQYRGEDVRTGANANGRNSIWNIHRVAAGLGFSPLKKLTTNASLLYEKHDLETPIEITAAASDWAKGTAAYDYRADHLTGMVDAAYAFTPSVKGMADYQQTHTMGTNAYRYQKMGAGMSFTVAGGNKIGVGGEYFNFADEAGFGFDNYAGYGFKTTYTCRF